MAEEKKIQTDSDLDLDAFAAEQHTDRYVKFEGRRYPIRGIYDMDVDQVFKLMGLNQRLQEGGYDHQITEMKGAIALLLPTMPEETLNRMSGRLMSHVLRGAFKVAGDEAEGRPTEGGGTMA